MKNKFGFTLLELLISLFIFTLIAIILTTALHRSFSLEERVKNSLSQSHDLQMAMLIFGRDLAQTIARPIKDNNGQAELAFVGSPESLEFTRVGFINPFGQFARSNMQRLKYQLSKEQFDRESWPTLDRVTQTQSEHKKLLSGVSEISFKYLDAEGHLSPTWPPANGNHLDTHPIAVELNLTLKAYGKIRLVFPLTEGSFNEN